VDFTVSEVLPMSTQCSQTVSAPGDGQLMQFQTSSNSLAWLENAFEVLTRTESLEEIKSVRDKAEAVRQYAHNAKASLALQNRAAELKLRAERRAGQLLRAMGLHGGDRKSPQGHARPTLEELGISHNQSKRWQKESLVPEPDFCAFVALAEKGEHELTTASLLRLAATRFGPASRKEEEVTRDLNVLPLDTLRGADRDVNQPREIVAELRNHCKTLDGILSPLYEGGNPAQFHPCLGRALQRLVREIRGLLAELEKCTAATGKE
jgi:hypothetical protein